MAVLKAVQQHYATNPQTLRLLEQFRLMTNHVLQIGLAENLTSLKALSLRAYRQLAAYEVMSYYKPCAISAATGILRNRRRATRRGERARIPYVRSLRLTTCYGFRIKDGSLLLPNRPGEPIRIPLTTHVQATIGGYEVRSVTLTRDKLSLSYAKRVAELNPRGLVGVDRNLDNVTLAATNGSECALSHEA
jgi:hypothetical protein